MLALQRSLSHFFPRSLIDTGVPWQGHLKAYYHLYKAVTILRSMTFDIVHAHLSSAADMYVFPLTAHMTTPMVTTLHSCFPFDRVQSWKGDADKWYLEWLSPTPVVAISESARAEVPYALNFVGTVHHGIPIEQFEPTAEPADFFAWLGRFVPEKGAHLAIQAAQKAGVPLVLAGTVDRYMDESVHYFNDVIKPLIDDQQVKYIGPVNMEQKIRLLSCARGFLNPIEWEEPFGMVMIEAMAVGCPVITFARGAAAEIVCHKKSGFLVHDVNEMVQFIPRVRELDRSAGTCLHKATLFYECYGNKYQKMYKKVIASSRQMVASPSCFVKGYVFPRLLPRQRLAKIDDSVRVAYPAALTRATREVEPQT